MVEMKGLTLGQLADLYDQSTPEVQKWMHENIHQVLGKWLCDFWLRTGSVN